MKKNRLTLVAAFALSGTILFSSCVVIAFSFAESNPFISGK